MEDIIGKWTEEIQAEIEFLSKIAKKEDFEEHPNPIIGMMLSKFFGMRKQQPDWIQQLIEKLISQYLVSDNKRDLGFVFIDSVTKVATIKLIIKLLYGSEHYLEKAVPESLKEIKMLNLVDNAIFPPKIELN